MTTYRPIITAHTHSSAHDLMQLAFSPQDLRAFFSNNFLKFAILENMGELIMLAKTAGSPDFQPTNIIDKVAKNSSIEIINGVERCFHKKGDIQFTLNIARELRLELFKFNHEEGYFKKQQI